MGESKKLSTEHDVPESAIDSSDAGSQRDGIEILLDQEQAAMQRRRSSLVATFAPLDKEEALPITDCFVHQLLEGHKRSAAPSPRLPSHAIHESPIAEESEYDLSRQYPFQYHEHQTQSRLLSKKQLSDMALGIRELSKTLAHLRLKLKVQNIFILGKIHDKNINKLARQLVEWLLASEHHHRVYIENTLEKDPIFDAQGLLAKDASFEKRLKFWDNEMCAKTPQLFDVVLALGGDGTVLYASWIFQRVVPPVIAFAQGSLGFLTKFDFESHQESLSAVFSRGFNVNLRLRFEAVVMRNQHDKKQEEQGDLVEEIIGELSAAATHHPESSRHILNEVVIDRGPNGTMVSLEVFGDKEHFTTIQADGICVATPTGSTAYNLAAGGSLCHPDNPVVLLTAICAHTLTFRPIILPDTIVLRIGVPYDARTNAWASFDGKERVELLAGDYVTISASRFPFPQVLPVHQKTENWIDSISRTLNWNARGRPKKFEDGNQG